MKKEQKLPITLKMFREAAHLTQPELSRRMHVGIRIIGEWESGRAIPRFDRAITLARELGISLKTLAISLHLDVDDLPDDEPQIAKHPSAKSQSALISK